MENLNNKPVKIIGYEESAFTRGLIKMSKEKEYTNLLKKNNVSSVDTISPEEFINLKNKTYYQYTIGFSLDMIMRKKICDIIDEENLDCPTFIDSNAVILGDCNIGKGVLIGPFSLIQNCTIENYCFIEAYCLVAHDVTLGRNTILHPGSMIAGKTTIGENCTFGFKSSVINNVNVSDNVNLGAFSNITKDITKSGNYVGTIARRIGE